MGMSLSGTKRTLCMNLAAWSFTLCLAFDNGWRPRGTLPPIHGPYDGGQNPDAEWNAINYSSNDGQLVDDQDAANLADALERALFALGNVEWADQLRDVITFCREGGFRLY
jgi:hypothetical protein